MSNWALTQETCNFVFLNNWATQKYMYKLALLCLYYSFSMQMVVINTKYN